MINGTDRSAEPRTSKTAVRSLSTDGFVMLPSELAGDSIPGFYDHQTHELRLWRHMDQEAVIELEYALRKLTDETLEPPNELS